MLKKSKYTAVRDYGVAHDQNARYRRTMEDAHVFLDGFDQKPDELFAAIYDGHGGRAAVDHVADHLHKLFQGILRESGENPNMPEVWKRTFLRVDEQLKENGILYAGTTAIVTYVRRVGNKRFLYAANVGDARTVLSRAGRAHRLTYDHKGSDPDEVQRIVDTGGFVTANRVNGILAVTRALGDHVMKDSVVADPYTYEVLLQGRDDVLIMACDGLWDVMGDQEAVDFIRGEQNAERAARMLLDHAFKSGSTDNISVMVIYL
eukprot:TRINITY_DN93_c0_g1_i5.p1 TRINITY_DN93_c0_g1~~TRINITY_DN93_c0_g1_i5.p1  ORF type:complete len:262 (-),score=57.82 TRINITY_DN93_c0_g1_i5:406-1191(-)